MAHQSDMAALKPLRLARGRRWICALGLALAAWGGATSLHAAADQREVQAVFLLNLARFIRWPDAAFARADAPFVIGCLPNDPVLPLIIEAAKGEFVGKRPIEVRETRSLADLGTCHMVHFSNGEMGQAAQFVAHVRTKPVLTVSDAEGFFLLGGHVQLQSRGGQFKLRLELSNLRRSGLAASAPLLRVAELVGQ